MNKMQGRKAIIGLIIGSVLLVIVGYIGSRLLMDSRNATDIENRYWEQSVKEDTPIAYSKYIIQFPDGKHFDKAKNRIQELENQQANKIENDTIQM